MQVVAITGGKGGVGKTNIAVNISVALGMQGKDVMLFDADLGLANVDLLMGLSVEYTLADVISGEKCINDVVIRGQGGVRVIPAASGIVGMVNLSPTDRAEVIQKVSDGLVSPEVLIVDTGAGIDETVQTFVAACKTPILVVCDEPASLTDCYALIKVLRSVKSIKDFYIVVNQVDTPLQGKRLFDRLSSVANRNLDVHLSYFGSIPTDPYLKRAVQERRPLVAAYPRSPAARAIISCAEKVGALPERDPSSGMAFFLEGLLHEDTAA